MSGVTDTIAAAGGQAMEGPSNRDGTQARALDLCRDEKGVCGGAAPQYGDGERLSGALSWTLSFPRSLKPLENRLFAEAQWLF